ncbi:MAG TPA: DUF1203 domain-containing protein [Hyphomonas sp.]|nr:DUF1203 domain-containing protein [Hyphomonas sp.]HRX72480.1 DUF1203 domain-containing protein [Hyphomonas sp.]
MPFQIHALPAEDFAALAGLDAEALSGRLAQRQVADSCPGVPCRVSLEDAQPGETVYLLNFAHQDTATPFRASHAIFVREGAATAHPAAGEVPLMIRRRIISLRAFDANGMMIEADVTEGENVAARIEALFGNPSTEVIHLHFAKQGCFAARVSRA